MSIGGLFDSGFRKRNQDHFAAIVSVAMSDGVISKEEKAFLDRLATKLDISEANYKIILEDYKSHPVNPPVSYERRLERLYDLTRMVFADSNLGGEQVVVLKKLAVGLGFNPDNAGYVVDKALKLVGATIDVDAFVEEIKNMNR